MNAGGECRCIGIGVQIRDDLPETWRVHVCTETLHVVGDRVVLVSVNMNGWVAVLVSIDVDG